jgi:outer membrane lipoprotein carrier protein
MATAALLSLLILVPTAACARTQAAARPVAQAVEAVETVETPAPTVVTQAAPSQTAPAPTPAAKPAPATGGKGSSAEAPKPSSSAATPKPAAMDAEVKSLVDRMQAFYEKTQDFTANFKQDYTYKTFKRTQSSSGKVTFKKPALMRWGYEKPSPKTFVLAGEKVYAHDPEAMTLTKGNIAGNQLSASVTFLWGKGRLADEFSIARVECKKCQGVQLEMTPLKPDPRFQKVILEVDPKTAQVLKSTVIDPDGSENAISFLDMKTNTGVDEKHFKLTPPEGTQIVDMSKPPQ